MVLIDTYLKPGFDMSLTASEWKLALHIGGFRKFYANLRYSHIPGKRDE